MKVFITGGSGFIGSHLIDGLLRAGHDITAFVRKDSEMNFMPVDKIALRRGDLCDYEGLKRGMNGCSVVFHVAALCTDWASEREFHETNVVGTRNVLKAARENNIDRIIFVSSTGVLGEEDCKAPKTEDSSYKPRMSYFLSRWFESGMNNYRYTKMVAESESIEYCRKNRMNITVIRPVWVYGPREFHAGPFEFCSAVSRGHRIMPMGKRNRFHVIFVKDLAQAVISAMEKNLPGVNIFNVGNTTVPLMRDYFNLFCEHMDAKNPVYVPFYLIYPFAVVLEILAKLLRSRKPYLLTRARVKMFYCNNIYDVSRAQKVLGFVPGTSLEEGVKETVNWWIEKGYLQKRG